MPLRWTCKMDSSCSQTQSHRGYLLLPLGYGYGYSCILDVFTQQSHAYLTRGEVLCAHMTPQSCTPINVSLYYSSQAACTVSRATRQR